MEDNIIEIKNQAKSYYQNAIKFYEIKQLSNACNEFKKSILLAEKIYHYEETNENEEFLLNNYIKIANCFNEIYKLTNNKKDLSPANIYYEKVIYIYEASIKKTNELDTLICKLLEIYMMFLWTSLEIEDYKSYLKFKKYAYNYAKKYIKLTKKYESHQYLILLLVFDGDYHVIKKSFKKAYLMYYIAMNKLSKIYKKLPQIAIKNDLILVYKNLSEIAKILNKNKQKIKWDKAYKQLGGE